MSRTTSVIPGWWVEFQAGVLRQLPRPGEITQARAEEWSSNQRNLKKVLSDSLLNEEPKILGGLLQDVGLPFAVPAIERFDAGSKFVPGPHHNELRISRLSTDFRRHFLRIVEEAVPAATLKPRKLKKSAPDEEIVGALGDMDFPKIEKAKVALSSVFEFLKKANHSRGKGLIFYVGDVAGHVWAVCAQREVNGWSLEMSSTEHYGQWKAGDYVVSYV
jgi:hypothetical protein